MWCIYRTIMLLALWVGNGALSARAQSVLASGGTKGNAGNLSVAWTVGEPITPTTAGIGLIATQGFHQPPSDFNTWVLPRPTEPDVWQLYPNPTRDLIQFSTTAPNAYQAEVIDAVGHRTLLWPINAARSLWSVDGLASGAYHLRVLDRSGNELHTLEFIVSQ